MKKTTPPTNERRIKEIETQFASVMKSLGLNLKDASLKDTPLRVAKMYVNETCAALFTEPPKITTFPNKGYDQMLLEKDITIHSMCEHHFVPFVGKCHIAYLPDKEVIGLSKLIRVAQYFSAKPQLQERLTTEIANFLQTKLKTENVAVIIEAKHFCCSIRGARDINSSTTTSYLGGSFRNTDLRTELFNLIK